MAGGRRQEGQILNPKIVAMADEHRKEMHYNCNLSPVTENNVHKVRGDYRWHGVYFPSPTWVWPEGHANANISNEQSTPNKPQGNWRNDIITREKDDEEDDDK